MYSIKDLHKYSHDLNVLYVEDDDNLRNETETLFKMLFKNIDTAEDGSVGLQKFNDNFYDLVISDVNMPKMNGIEMCKKIREINSEQKIIIVSAHDESHILIDLIQAGANGFILKPMHMDDLVTALYPVCRDAYTQIINLQLIEELNDKNALLEEQIKKLRTSAHTIQTKHHQLEDLIQEKNACLDKEEAQEVIENITGEVDQELLTDYFKEDEDEGAENVLFLADHCADLSEIFTEIPEIISRFETDKDVGEIHTIIKHLYKASSIFVYYSPYLDLLSTSFTELASTMENNLDAFLALMDNNADSVLMLFDAVSSDIERYIERFQVESLAMKNSHHIHEPTALSIQQIITLIVPPEEDEGDMDDIFDF